jgi:hypothetical protein
MRSTLGLGILAGLLLGLGGTSSATSFFDSAYWDSGKAEFQVYDASLSKYGTDRPATVKLILVKEPFDVERLVKTLSAEGAVDVVKMNWIQHIPTGIYDYCQTASIFFERATGRILKYTMSSQDGCGNTFMEYRRREERHLFRYHSYFDDQGDSVAVLEDGEFTFYDALPVVLRFRLTEAADYRLKIMDPLLSNQAVPLTIREGLVRNRPEANREVGGKTYRRVVLCEVLRGEKRDLFVFEADYPHRLLEWTQADGGSMRLDQSHFLYYWLHTKPEDRSLGIVRDRKD